MASTDSSSSLVKNTDFSAELLLNKVMNSQYKATSGKTLTLGGRMNASKLDADAHTFNAVAGNVERGSVIVDATQDSLTEILSLVKKAQEGASTSDTAAVKALGEELYRELTALTGAQADSFSYLTGTTSLNIGLNSNTMAIGVNITSNAGYQAFTQAISTMTSSGTAADATFISALNGLNAEIAVQGAKSNVIHNRYDVLNDLAAQYKAASDAQAVTAGGSASSLLNNLL